MYMAILRKEAEKRNRRSNRERSTQTQKFFEPSEYDAEEYGHPGGGTN